MTLSFSNLVERAAEFCVQKLAQQKQTDRLTIGACPEIRELFLALGLYARRHKRDFFPAAQIIYVTQSEAQTERVIGRMTSWTRILDLGQQTRHKFGSLQHNTFQALESFAQHKLDFLICDRSFFLRPVPSRSEFGTTGLTLDAAAHLNLNVLYDRLLSLGYQSTEMVTGPNEISRRGGIIDIFPPRLDHPARLEFWGDEVASIRFFDTTDQRSLTSSQNKVQTLHIPSLSERSFSGSLLDYAADSLLITEGALPPGETDAEKIALEATLREAEKQWTWSADEEQGDVVINAQAIPSALGKLKTFYTELDRLSSRQQPSLILSTQSKRLESSLTDFRTRVAGLRLRDAEQIPEMIQFLESETDLFPIPGFHSPDLGFNVFSDFEIFGLVQSTRHTMGHLKRQYKNFLYTVEKGDMVVHADHGIAVFEDVMRMTAAGIEREYLLLRFQGEDKVYLPTSQIYKLSKYVGKDREEVVLSKLGGKSWSRERRKAEADTAAIAHELLSLYAKRAQNPGHAFGPDDYLERDLETSFPYLETPDQLRAIHEVKKDMQSEQPMDRLVCGDVGFGKTEVALRAAFKAVMGGKQVAILCPTTILAEQHYQTFQSRLQQFSVEMALLSRLRKPRENTQALSDLKSGKVDIIVGTHRLLSEDVRFADLGLLIVDEEQRFGVTHKERIKSFRTHVDILSLSATPIPRTLNLALTGIRDVSLIATPPRGRLPILTYVLPYADHLLKTAIETELGRGGQVFVVFNRVKTIDRFAEHLAELIPKARIAVGHGQLDSEELEEKMYAFVHHDIDVLVSSTIIENGVDIPLANTMLVIGAEDFGLASLYQLKGRIGRSDRQAHAYFLYREDKLTPKASERLQALQDNTELGSGLSIALRDLEIRGAGNILGTEQSGHIDGVGFELYSRLLRRAISRQAALLGDDERGDADQEEMAYQFGETSIDLPLSAYLPEDYIQSDSEKMSLYQRMSEIETDDELRDLSVEIGDRFGAQPLVVTNLLTLLHLRLLASKAGISKLWIQNGLLFLDFKNPPTARQREALYAAHSDFKIDDKVAKLHFRKLGESYLNVLEDQLSLLAL